MTARLVKKLLPPLIPYITVGIGLLVLKNVWAAMLGYHAGMAVVILLSNTKPSLKDCLKSRSVWLPLIAALGGACAGVLLHILRPMFSVPDDIAAYTQRIGLTDTTWPFFIVYFVLVNPFLEEYYWRGLLGSSNKMVTVNDAMFAGYHLLVLGGQMEFVWLIPVFALLTAGGWLWRQMNRINGGLLTSMLSHLTGDLTVILAIWFMVTR